MKTTEKRKELIGKAAEHALRRFSELSAEPQVDSVRKPRVLLFGSNYQMFKGAKKCDENGCAAADAMPQLAEPAEAELTAFEIILEARKILAENGIPSSVILMPSDIPKGLEREKVKEFRAKARSERKMPDSMESLIQEYGLSGKSRLTRDDLYLDRARKTPAAEALARFLDGDSFLFAIESEWKTRAGRTLEKILDGKIQLPEGWRLHGNGCDIMVSARALQIIIGTGLDNGAVPNCPLICAEFLKEMEKLGFTHLISAFSSDDARCVSKGVLLARRLLDVPLSTLVISVYENGDVQYLSKNAEQYRSVKDTDAEPSRGIPQDPKPGTQDP